MLWDVKDEMYQQTILIAGKKSHLSKCLIPILISGQNEIIPEPESGISGSYTVDMLLAFTGAHIFWVCFSQQV